jgi:uncharacterized protein YqeY
VYNKIKNDIKDAMRAKDSIRLETLRGLSAVFINELLKKPKDTSLPAEALAKVGLSDDEVIAVIRRAVKQRRDSIEQFEKGERKDLADKEKAELVILESYLPKLMSREEIEKFVRGKIAGGMTFDKAKIGQFMGLIMKELKGKADGADVKVVIEKLV